MAVGCVAGADGQRRGERRVDAVRDRQPRLIGAGRGVGVRRIGRGRRRAVAESPRVGERLALGIGGAGAREIDRERRRALPWVSRRPATTGGRFGLHVADAADLADAECAADVRVAEVDVVERAVGALGQIHDVAVGPVDRAVGRLEIEDAGDVAVGIERQALDPVLRVVGEEVAALVAARELRAVIDEPARDGRVAPVVRIVVGRSRVGGIAVRRFDVRPAVVGAARADVDFLDRGRVVVAADVADDQPAGRRVVVGAVRIAQAERPDRVVVRARCRRRTDCRSGPCRPG